MRGWMTSTSAGVVSGTVTCAASLHALGYTSALVMPSWASPDAWNALVVLGVGATLVALVVHSIVLHVLRCRTALALVSRTSHPWISSRPAWLHDPLPVPPSIRHP
jgi:hypothetical protein